MKKLFLTPKQKRNLIKNKKKIEDELNIKISFLKDDPFIEGSATDEYEATKVIDALNLGFELKLAILLKDEEYMLERISIKDYIKTISQNRLKQIKARIIGKKGKAIQNIMSLTDCAIRLRNNDLAVLGRVKDVKTALDALISLIKGSKHGNVYSKIERNKSKMQEQDLGLRI